MWDFDRMRYHDWLGDEGITLPDPESASRTSRIQLHGRQLEVGIGIHDSSSSLVPYLKNSGKSFVLLSTGTWCVIMNPFSQEPLTADQLRGNCLCYLSTDRKPVKSSLFFMGRVHDLNVERLTAFFGEKQGIYRTLQPDPGELRLVRTETRKGRYFFKSGVPDNLVDQQADLSVFGSFRDAYARLLADLTGMVVDALKLVLPGHESPDILYITGGFSKNPYFTGFLALAFPGTRVFTSEVANATSLGAAMVIAPAIWPGGVPRCDLGLKPVMTGISS
jgi:sugar (pentulose or hexulose) kinase